jgi:hypothetical protein
MWKLPAVRAVDARLDTVEAEMRALKAFLCEMRDELRSARTDRVPAPPLLPATDTDASDWNVVRLHPTSDARPSPCPDARAACDMLRRAAGDLRSPGAERAA